MLEELEEVEEVELEDVMSTAGSNCFQSMAQEAMIRTPWGDGLDENKWSILPRSTSAGSSCLPCVYRTFIWSSWQHFKITSLLFVLFQEGFHSHANCITARLGLASTVEHALTFGPKPRGFLCHRVGPQQFIVPKRTDHKPRGWSPPNYIVPKRADHKPHCSPEKTCSQVLYSFFPRESQTLTNPLNNRRSFKNHLA